MMDAWEEIKNSDAWQEVERQTIKRYKKRNIKRLTMKIDKDILIKKLQGFSDNGNKIAERILEQKSYDDELGVSAKVINAIQTVYTATSPEVYKSMGGDEDQSFEVIGQGGLHDRLLEMREWCREILGCQEVVGRRVLIL